MTAATLPGTAPDRALVIRPGVYDISPEAYHADPVPGGSLSSSGARRLLPPDGCPALFKHERDHGQRFRRVFEIGHAAHAQALGTGPELVRIDAPEWRSGKTKEQVAEARARGAVPLHHDEWDQITAMVAALRADQRAAALLNAERARFELSLFWQDHDHDIRRRARPDVILDDALIDYKTCTSAAPAKLMADLHKYGYHQQGDWYLAGARALRVIGPNARFMLIAQEKTAPYLVNVVELDSFSLLLGHDLNQRAMELYARCTSTNHWPGYSETVDLIGVPEWVERAYYREQD